MWWQSNVLLQDLLQLNCCEGKLRQPAGTEGTERAQAAVMQERSRYECSERWCLILISFTSVNGRNCSTGSRGISQLKTGGGFRTLDSWLKRNVLTEM